MDGEHIRRFSKLIIFKWWLISFDCCHTYVRNNTIFNLLCLHDEVWLHSSRRSSVHIWGCNTFSWDNKFLCCKQATSHTLRKCPGNTIWLLFDLWYLVNSRWKGIYMFILKKSHELDVDDYIIGALIIYIDII